MSIAWLWMGTFQNNVGKRSSMKNNCLSTSVHGRKRSFPQSRSGARVLKTLQVFLPAMQVDDTNCDSSASFANEGAHHRYWLRKSGLPCGITPFKHYILLHLRYIAKCIFYYNRKLHCHSLNSLFYLLWLAIQARSCADNNWVIKTAAIASGVPIKKHCTKC